MPSVLFVCTANLCRSPMAEAIFRSRLVQEGRASEWRIGSAGTLASPGLPPTDYALEALHELGLDLGDHRSQLVTGELLRSYSLTLVMEKGHKEALRVEFPEIAGRVYLLSEMTGDEYSIPDPIGGDLPRYRELASELAELMDQGLDRIVELAGGMPSQEA